MRFVPSPWDDSRVRRQTMQPIFEDAHDIMFSYLYARRPAALELLGKIKSSKHLWLDSSGFQAGYGRARKFSIFDIFDLQQQWADTAFTFDLPGEPEQTFRNAVLSLTYSKGYDRKPRLYAVVAHKGSTGIAQDLAKKYEAYDFDGLALGSTIPYGSSDMAEFFSLLSIVARSTTKPIHAFGVGGFDAIHLLEFLGVSSFDSSRFLTAARSLHYLTPHGTLYVGNRYQSERGRGATSGALPCECPACRTAGSFEYFQRRGAEPVGVLALHNYYSMRNELRLIEIAKREGWFNRLLEGRARRSPRLRSVLNHVKQDYFVGRRTRI